ncbi:hypothetical protein BD289DRAFT_438793 [Coniella lustricola]|uniref:Fungal-specific transcription factor domain-domain-containing protein n=1 Tax=Coniella lustricola TaxID=2025994 RepID=A0A2T3A2G8_9PEZI|nr:hypothetical protein BD289DRAFT_438793 [Coniella lustricola]
MNRNMDVPMAQAQHEAHQFIMAASQQQQQQQQQQFSRHQGGFPVPQETRPEAYSFMQPAMGSMQPPVGLIPADTTATHMISTLNWLSPTMDFDLVNFDYNQVAPNEQYWGSASNQVNDLTDQSPSISAPLSGSVHHPSTSSLATFQGDTDEAELPGKAYVDNKGARQPRNGRYANRIFSDAGLSESPHSYFEPPVRAPEPGGFTLILPHSPDIHDQKLANINVQSFSIQQYQILCQHFHDHCLTPRNPLNSDSATFYPAELPSMASFTRLMKLYRKHFDPRVLPIIHHNFEASNSPCSWIINLAMAAIGSQYLEMANTELSVALHEFLRRVLLVQRPAAVYSTFSAQRLTGTVTAEDLVIVQAKLLNYIGIAYSGAGRLEKYRESALEDLLNEHKILYQAATSPSGTTQHTAISARNTQEWILVETSRRLCHAIWLVETMTGYHSPASQPKLLLDYANIALPCHEDIWQAAVTHQDQAEMPPSSQAQSQAREQPSLEKAIRVLYIEKRLLPDTGDFARVLIIHGLYCHTWDIARSLTSRPLLRWTPSAQKGNAESVEMGFGRDGVDGDAANTSGKRHVGEGGAGEPGLETNLSMGLGPGLGLSLPQIPLYNHWRNATCDCLDVLHWLANSDIAKTGTENSTVLHLHFARIVLLAPYETIRELADVLICTAPITNSEEDGQEDMERARQRRRERKIQELSQRILKWITEDQFKARLALVHCGVLFWHVRRYATDAFNEPGKVFLATLVVWAYGSVCPPQQPQQQSLDMSTATRGAPSQRSGRSARFDRSLEEGEHHDEKEVESDVEAISSIRLDRPTDDELVQIFIKRGRSMTATISGVGNITGHNGPTRMLREGCKLINTLNKWPVRHQYLETLTRLLSVCGRR